MDIQINDFDLHEINQRRLDGSSPTILIIGGRGKGKSNLAKAIMRAVQKIPSGVVFSGTETSNPFYQDIVPPLFTFSHMDKNVISSIIEAQKKAEDKKDVFVLLDDMMFDPGFLRQPLMKSIFLNGRHYRITLLLTTQYAIDVPCGLRSNIDYVFLLRENNVHTCTKLYKNFGGVFPNQSLFFQAMKVCCADFGALVIDNVNEKVHKIRLDLEHEHSAKFRMFSPSVWKYAMKHTNMRGQHDVIADGDCRIIIDK